MRFVAVKSEAAQASATIFRTRDLLVRQWTQNVNALCALASLYIVIGEGLGMTAMES